MLEAIRPAERALEGDEIKPLIKSLLELLDEDEECEMVTHQLVFGSHICLSCALLSRTLFSCTLQICLYLMRLSLTLTLILILSLSLCVILAVIMRSTELKIPRFVPLKLILSYTLL